MLMTLHPLYFVFAIPALVLSLLARAWVKGAYAKYRRVPNRSGFTGARAAAEMLRREGVFDVSIVRGRGELSDHYDPTQKVIRLSPDVHDGTSVAAVGIACHEAGHALQHAQAYALLALRSWSVPMASLGGAIGPGLLGIGLALDMVGLVMIGLLLFAGVFLFQLITLPVELDASSRAKIAVARDGIVGDADEAAGVARVLRAAAFTYVAALVSTLLILLYYLYRAGLLGGSRRN